MGGGYISCGDFEGNDKSGSPFEAVIDAIEESLDPMARPDSGVFDEIRAAVDTQQCEYRIPSALAARLRPFVEEYHQKLGERLGFPDPVEAPDFDDEDLDPTEAKYGAGLGWRYYCTSDLITALSRSEATGEDVVISFD